MKKYISNKKLSRKGINAQRNLSPTSRRQDTPDEHSPVSDLDKGSGRGGMIPRSGRTNEIIK